MKIPRSFLLLLIVSAAACEQPVRAPANQADAQHDVLQPTSQDPVDQPAQVISLVGEWRVAGIDGHSVDEPYALSLTGDDRQLWWEPRCAGYARTYRIEGQSIAFGPTQPPLPAGSPPRPVCAIGLPPRLGDVARALDHAVSISRTSNNGVLISGPDHSLTLFSQ